MDKTVHLQTFSTYNYSFTKVKEYIIQVERITKQVENTAKKYGKNDRSKETCCLIVFYQNLIGEVKN
jgi:hypothetical protein